MKVKYADGDPNTAWANLTSTWVVYCVAVTIVRLVLWATLPDPCIGWSILNMSHSAATFVLFHWLKGSPFDDKHKLVYYTFWEQIDHGVQWTPTRKFLMVVPVLIYALTVNCSRIWVKEPLFIANTVAFALALIPKMPFMNHVRLLDINK